MSTSMEEWTIRLWVSLFWVEVFCWEIKNWDTMDNEELIDDDVDSFQDALRVCVVGGSQYRSLPRSIPHGIAVCEDAGVS